MAKEDVLKNKYCDYNAERVKRIVEKYNKYKELAKRNREFRENFKKEHPIKNGKMTVISREYPEYDKMAGEADEAFDELKGELKSQKELLLELKALKIEDDELKEKIAEAVFTKRK